MSEVTSCMVPLTCERQIPITDQNKSIGILLAILIAFTIVTVLSCILVRFVLYPRFIVTVTISDETENSFENPLLSLASDS